MAVRGDQVGQPVPKPCPPPAVAVPVIVVRVPVAVAVAAVVVPATTGVRVVVGDVRLVGVGLLAHGGAPFGLGRGPDWTAVPPPPIMCA